MNDQSNVSVLLCISLQCMLKWAVRCYNPLSKAFCQRLPDFGKRIICIVNIKQKESRLTCMQPSNAYTSLTQRHTGLMHRHTGLAQRHTGFTQRHAAGVGNHIKWHLDGVSNRQ